MSVYQIYKSEQFDLLAGTFQARDEPNFAAKSQVSAFMGFTGLRGLWAYSVYHLQANRLRDVSGCGNDLDGFGTANEPTVVAHGVYSYWQYTSSDAQYHQKADAGAGDWADITGTEVYVDSAWRGLTLGGWFRFDNAIGSLEYLIAKRGAAGTLAYNLERRITGALRFQVSTDGTALVSVSTGVGTLGQNQWYYLVGRFRPSAELFIALGSAGGWQTWTNTVTVPASIFDSGAAFTLGASSLGTQLFDGRTGIRFLCAAAVPEAQLRSAFEQTRALYGV